MTLDNEYMLTKSVTVFSFSPISFNECVKIPKYSLYKEKSFSPEKDNSDRCYDRSES